MALGFAAIAPAFLAVANGAEWTTPAENFPRRLPPIGSESYGAVAADMAQPIPSWDTPDSLGLYDPADGELAQAVSFERDQPEIATSDDPPTRFVMQPQPGGSSPTIAAGVAAGADISLRGMSDSRRG